MNTTHLNQEKCQEVAGLLVDALVQQLDSWTSSSEGAEARVYVTTGQLTLVWENGKLIDSEIEVF